MLLLTFAHRPEAKAFIRYFKDLKPHPDQSNLYIDQSNNLGLLITGEGCLNSALSLTRALTLDRSIHLIINLGVAGSLSKNISKGEICVGRNVYFGQDANNKQMEYKSYPLQKEIEAEVTYDIVTARERVLKPNERKYYSHFGDIVDRELWGLATAAKEIGRGIISIKIISDTNEDIDACQITRDKSDKFSHDLLQFYLANFQKENWKKTKQNNSELENFLHNHPHLFLTLAQKNLIKKYAKKVKLHKNLVSRIEQIIRENYKARPKDLATKVLNIVAHEYSPILHHLQGAAKREIYRHNISEIKFSPDTHFESNDISFHGKIRSKEDVEKIINQIKKISLSKWQATINGEDLV